MTVLDGAMGTELLRRGASLERGLDSMNLSHPEWVAEIHRSYVDAGAEILETNTFGGNRARLEAVGMGDSLAAINEAGVRLARGAAGDRARVAGCIGPMGRSFENYLEQASNLYRAGVDLFVLETFTDVKELETAITACRSLDAGILIAAHVTLDAAGALPAGFAESVSDWPADIAGVNCSYGPEPILRVLSSLMERTAKPISVMPSVDENCTPELFADIARQFADSGAALLGGCCGTTPAHIAKIAVSLRDNRSS